MTEQMISLESTMAQALEVGLSFSKTYMVFGGIAGVLIGIIIACTFSSIYHTIIFFIKLRKELKRHQACREELEEKIHSSNS